VDWHAIFGRCSGGRLAVALSILMCHPLPALAQAGATNDVHPADWPALPRAVTLQPGLEKFVQQLLDAMTLAAH
jgi:hypothetical protein